MSRVAGVTRTSRRGIAAAHPRQGFARRHAERIVDHDGAPGLLRQQCRGDLLVGNDDGMRAPALQPPRDQRGLDRRRRDDENILAGEVGHGERRRGVGVAGVRQRNGDAEGRAVAGAAVERDRAAHALDDPLGNGEAEAGAAELARRAAVALLELEEDPRLILCGDADAGVAHREGRRRPAARPVRR